jgi:hypothetical protein
MLFAAVFNSSKTFDTRLAAEIALVCVANRAASLTELSLSLTKTAFIHTNLNFQAKVNFSTLVADF